MVAQRLARRTASNYTVFAGVQLGISVSTIETLDDGMTRLVCTTGKGAQEVRAKFRKFVLDNSHRAQSAFDHLRREENI